MKKYLSIPCACLSLCLFENAHAQSYVNISGVIDNAVTSVKTTQLGRSVHKIGLYGSGMSSNLLRFDGREDLGDGWYAPFRLESGLNSDTGTGIASNSNNQRSGAGPADSGLTFNRWAFVGIGNNQYGEIRAGRVYSANFESFTPFDPFLTNGIGSSTALSLRLGVRNTQTALNVSNAIEYLSPNYGKGFFFRGTMAFGENRSNGSLATSNPRRGGDHQAVRLGYGADRWAVAYSAGLTHNTAGATPSGNNAGNYLSTNLSARYDFGWVKLFGQYVTESLDGASARGGALTGVASQTAKNRTFLLGPVFPVGAGNIKLSYVNGRLKDNIGSAPEHGQMFVVGYDYYFSKRTNIYLAVSHIKNNAVGNYGFAAAFIAPSQGQSSSGVSVGLRHLF